MTANRTALSAITAGRRSVLSGLEPVVWGLKLTNQHQSIGPTYVIVYERLQCNDTTIQYTCYTYVQYTLNYSTDNSSN